ncbi:MAG: glycosyltransferase family 2 protein [Leptospirales bacterium]
MTDLGQSVPISICIITGNEERNIAACLDSLGTLPDEVIILDGGSQDRTCEIAQSKGAVIHRHPFDGFGAQKQRAVDLARNDWVFFQDADERMTESLREELRDLLNSPHLLLQKAAYKVSRINYFGNRRIDHGGWEEDHLIRFFNRKKTSFDGKIVHEEIRTPEQTGNLKGQLNHFPVSSIEEFIQKNLRYARMKAETRKPISPFSAIFLMVFSPPAVFLRMYLLRLGFLDGLEGFVLASLYGFFSFMKVLDRIPSGKEY